jgi:hypothetical protein
MKDADAERKRAKRLDMAVEAKLFKKKKMLNDIETIKQRRQMKNYGYSKKKMLNDIETIEMTDEELAENERRTKIEKRKPTKKS